MTILLAPRSLGKRGHNQLRRAPISQYVKYHRLLYLLGNIAPLYQSILSSLTIYYSKPQVLIKVGNAGDIGSVEMQDLLFTTRGATAGLILVEWNIQADNPGSAALWVCHARVGGATGTKLTTAECPPVVLIKDVLLLV